MNRAEAEMVEGYHDGLDDDRLTFPEDTNRSDAYRHGWLNGRDDRIKQPRLYAAALRRIAERLIQEGA